MHSAQHGLVELELDPYIIEPISNSEAAGSSVKSVGIKLLTKAEKQAIITLVHLDN